MTMLKTYSELQKLGTFKERYDYLRLKNDVGMETFGFDRYLNQMLYKSREWSRIRDRVIIRDSGCDLGIIEYPITGEIVVHHINAITVDDVKKRNNVVFDPEFLICTTPITHRAIHYGDENLLPKLPVIRRPGDTTPWR